MIQYVYVDEPKKKKRIDKISISDTRYVRISKHFLRSLSPRKKTGGYQTGVEGRTHCTVYRYYIETFDTIPNTRMHNSLWFTENSQKGGRTTVWSSAGPVPWQNRPAEGELNAYRTTTTVTAVVDIVFFLFAPLCFYVSSFFLSAFCFSCFVVFLFVFRLLLIGSFLLRWCAW